MEFHWVGNPCDQRHAASTALPRPIRPHVRVHRTDVHRALADVERGGHAWEGQPRGNNAVVMKSDGDYGRRNINERETPRRPSYVARRFSARRCHASLKSSPMTNRHGVMNSTCRLEVTIPPMLGAAIGFMISIPAPFENITGNSDRTIAATVMSFGRNRVADPSMTASIYDWPGLR